MCRELGRYPVDLGRVVSRGRNEGNEPHLCARVWAWTVMAVIRSLLAAPTWLKEVLPWLVVSACLFGVVVWMTGGFAHVANEPEMLRWPFILAECSALGLALTWLWTKVIRGSRLARACASVTRHRFIMPLRDGCRASLTWVFVTSPPWARILLAWTLAALSLPFADLIMKEATVWNRSVIDPSRSEAWFFSVLAACLSICLVILVRGHYELSRVYFSRPISVVLSLVLSAAHALVYGVVSAVTWFVVALYSI